MKYDCFTQSSESQLWARYRVCEWKWIPKLCCCLFSQSCLTPWTAARQASLSVTFSGVCSNSCPFGRWCHPASSSSVIPFSSCLQSFPASGSFPMSQFYASGGQSIGASASVLLISPETCISLNHHVLWTMREKEEKVHLQVTNHRHHLLAKGSWRICCLWNDFKVLQNELAHISRLQGQEAINSKQAPLPCNKLLTSSSLWLITDQITRWPWLRPQARFAEADVLQNVFIVGRGKETCIQKFRNAYSTLTSVG